MSDNKLIFFTTTFPYGNGEFFIENEMPYISNAFHEIVIISNNTTDLQSRNVGSKVQLERISYNLSLTQKVNSLLNLFSPIFWQEIFMIRKIYRQSISIQIINTILQSIQKALVAEQCLKKHFHETEGQQIYLYSYWANDAAVSIAWLKYKGYPVKTLCRAHRWDIYFEKNGSNYLPLRKFIASNLDAVYFISQDGKKYFEEKVGYTFSSLKISKLGVFPVPENKNFDNTVFHLVSCSSVISRKRVGLIAEALATLPTQFSFKWTHLGDGPDMPYLKSKCAQLLDSKSNIVYHLAGGLSNEEVRSFYAHQSVDLFVNVSTSEGIPVSIMEAMSAGVPALATNVDGNGEIVKNRCNGYLVPSNISAKGLCKVIIDHHQLDIDKIREMRKQAKKTWQDEFNAEKNYSNFIADVLSL